MPSSTVVPAAGDEEDVSVAVVSHTPGATPIVDDDDATDVENAIDDLTDLTERTTTWSTRCAATHSIQVTQGLYVIEIIN